MAIKRGLIAGQLRRVIDADLDANGIDFKELLARTVKVLEVNEIGWYNDLSRLIDAALAAGKGQQSTCPKCGGNGYVEDPYRSVGLPSRADRMICSDPWHTDGAHDEP